MPQFFHTLIKTIELVLSKGVEHNTLRGLLFDGARGEAAVYRMYCPLSGCDTAERESSRALRHLRALGLHPRPAE